MKEMANDELTQGWAPAQLGDIIELKYGKALPDRLRTGSGFPVYGSNGVVGYHDQSLTNGETIIVGRKGSVGAVQYCEGPCSPIDTTYFIDQLHGLPAKYWFHFLRSLQLVDLNKATAVPGLNREDAYRLKILVPPPAEQKRIADKLEAVLGRVDACRARLDRVPDLLKRFRQSVLAAATSGQLTEDWREEKSQTIELLGWSANQLSDLAEVIDPNPSHRYPSYENGEVPIVSTEQMKGLSDWNLAKAKQVDRAFFESRRIAHGFQKSDIIFARKGRLGLARRPPPVERYVFSHTVFIVRAKDDDVSHYLLWALRKDDCVDWLLREMNSNIGVPTLGKSFMERLPINLPPPNEQAEIVRRVEALFALADRIEARLASAQRLVERLTPATLSKAFCGDLVPQDPNDEPASKLLERLKAGPSAAVTPRRAPVQPVQAKPEPRPATQEPSAPKAAQKADRSVRAPNANRQAIPIDDTQRHDVLALIREVFATGGARDRDTALKEIATALGYERLGPHIREVLSTDIRTAVRRGILHNQGGSLTLLCRSIEDYERDFLKELFLAAISPNGRVWVERDDAIRLFTRWLGFRRTGATIDETARSLINGLLRDGSLEKDGPDWIRRV